MEDKGGLDITSASEFHDLAELALNSERQSWGNLGYWKDASEYSEACRALAVLVGEAAQLDEQSIVFDAGFGCGDQLLLWLTHFKVADICGANNSQSQTDRTKENLVTAGQHAAADDIVVGDACDQAIWDGVLQSRSINRVIALDCVYHFSEKERFLKIAYQHLLPEGRLALTDFMLADGSEIPSWKKWVLSLMFGLSRIPARNMKSQTEYIRLLEKAGFNDVDLVDITAHVLPRFGKWLRQFKSQSSDSLASIQWLKYDITARFLAWSHREKLLRYYVVSARRKS